MTETAVLFAMGGTLAACLIYLLWAWLRDGGQL